MAHADLLQDLPEPKCLAWLYKTARNLFIDQARRLAKAPKDESEGLFEADLSTVHVAQMLSRLPECERALFSLRYFQGFNATELGEMFDLPSSTVRARLLSARKHLQQIMKYE
jgi:RNA polymerase sigma-70 factor (ECF subfamily)